MAIDAADQRNHHTPIDRSVLGERRARGENRIEQTTRMCGLLVSCHSHTCGARPHPLDIHRRRVRDPPSGASSPEWETAPPQPRGGGGGGGATARRGRGSCSRKCGRGTGGGPRLPVSLENLCGGGRERAHWAVGKRGKRPMGRGGVRRTSLTARHVGLGLAHGPPMKSPS